jgi:hypothetical protein
MDTSFTIYKSDGRQVIAGGATSAPESLNSIARGGTVSYSFRNLETKLIVDSGETETIPGGDTETIDFATVADGGTLVVDGRLECDELDVDGTLDLNGELDVNERYALELEDLLVYREYAGQYNLRETLDSTQRYSEQIDESVLTTLVMGIEPSADLQDRGIPGVWGLVDTIRDERASTLTRSVVGIDLTVLAPFSEYDSVSAVKNDLKL